MNLLVLNRKLNSILISRLAKAAVELAAAASSTETDPIETDPTNTDPTETNRNRPDPTQTTRPRPCTLDGPWTMDKKLVLDHLWFQREN